MTGRITQKSLNATRSYLKRVKSRLDRREAALERRSRQLADTIADLTRAEARANMVYESAARRTVHLQDERSVWERVCT